MQFASDNRGGAMPEVLAALTDEAAHHGGAYGEDDTTTALERALAERFETSLRSYPVFTGTAANALSLSALCDPWGGVVCEADAHVIVDECGAVEYLGGGMRLVPIDGDHGRIDPADLDRRLTTTARNDVHQTPLQALSLTNLTEAGTAYDPEHLAALCDVAHRHGLRTHLDGARFANVVASSAVEPSALSWRAGIDVLVFGGTKNGCLAAEAVICFVPDLMHTFERRRKRAGHLASKLRFTSAQLLASLVEDRWIRWAAHANTMATRLANEITPTPGLTVIHPVEGNQVWIDAPAVDVDRWRAHGADFYDTRHGDRSVVRLVAGATTRSDEVDRFLGVVRGAPAGDRAGEKA